MIKARVKWFDIKKGFGIAVSEDRNEYFIHYSEILLPKNIKGYLIDNEEIIITNTEKINGKLSAKGVKPSGDKFLCENHKLPKKHIKNTESFDPNYDEPDMKVKIGNSNCNYNQKINSRDIILVPDLFAQEKQLYNDIYTELIKEINNTNIEENKLWKTWHGDTHTIADDKENWKRNCPLFNSIISKIETYFNMDIKATRFNWYKDTNDWKPFHHDAAAVKPEKSLTQNFTVGISFGYEREICFEHAKNRNKISFPMRDGSIYAFSKDINIEWRHGIQPIKKENYCNKGRISIIAWGKVDMENIN